MCKNRKKEKKTIIKRQRHNKCKEDRERQLIDSLGTCVPIFLSVF